MARTKKVTYAKSAAMIRRKGISYLKKINTFDMKIYNIMKQVEALGFQAMKDLSENSLSESLFDGIESMLRDRKSGIIRYAKSIRK